MAPGRARGYLQGMSYTITGGGDLAVAAKAARTPKDAIRVARAMQAQGLPNVRITNAGGVDFWSLSEFEELYEAEAPDA
jgi:hypothetical protein